MHWLQRNALTRLNYDARYAANYIIYSAGANVHYTSKSGTEC